MRDDEIGLKTLAFLEAHRARVKAAADAEGKDGWVGTPEGDDASRLRRVRWKAICAEKDALRALVLSLRFDGFGKFLHCTQEILFLYAEIVAWRGLEAAQKEDERMLEAAQSASRRLSRWESGDSGPRWKLEQEREAATKASSAAFSRHEAAKEALKNARAVWSNGDVERLHAFERDQRERPSPVGGQRPPTTSESDPGAEGAPKASDEH